MQGHDTGIKEEERDGKDMRQETGWRTKLQGHGTVVREKGSFGKDMRQDTGWREEVSRKSDRNQGGGKGW